MENNNSSWLDRRLHPGLPGITYEIIIFATIILVAIFTRFYNLDARVMSHDESLHTYFSWLLYRGQGYQHSPMMHGPFQFHALALVYYLFGVSDFTSRIPTALFSIAIVWMMWYWRRYLGRFGALIAALMLVISPYLLYYGRYVRNESFVAFSGVLLLYVMLRHLETGERKYLYLFTAALLLHFITKETSFIYTAQALLYLIIFFIAQATRQPWPGKANHYRGFIISLGLAVLIAAAAIGYTLYSREQQILTSVETAAPADPAKPITPLSEPESTAVSLTGLLGITALVAVCLSLTFLISGYGWDRIRAERSFNLLMIAGMLVLPLLSPFPIKWAERWLKVSIPTTAAEVQTISTDTNAMLVIGGVLVAMFALAIFAGFVWNKELWWKVFLLFWVPYTIFFTTVFTNSDGFFTGTIGSLGYWLVQQGVERGSQPWYYYAFIQIPIYEFLPALGFFLALVMGSRLKYASPDESHPENPVEFHHSQQVLGLLIWWCVTSIIAYSIAGERMPWLTVHIAWPLILITGWGFEKLIQGIKWQGLHSNNLWIVLATALILISSLSVSIYSAIGPHPPFQGKQLVELQATASFLLPLLISIASVIGLIYLLGSWSISQVLRVFTLTAFSLLALLTVRASFRASFVTYDQATEFLVYAHGARGVKDVLEQAKEISERTTGGMGAAIAYDASAPDTGVSWPFVWYLRDFTNQRSFDQPTRSLRDAVVVIVDQKNFDKIEAALGPGYYRMDYIRMWWPMQDYFGLVNERDPETALPEDYPCRGILGFFKYFKNRDYSRLCDAFTNPQIRAGVIQIWLNRDYTFYAQAAGRSDLSLTTWIPSDQMRLYIKKDVAAQVWNYGVPPVQSEEIVDPTEGKVIVLPADMILDGNSSTNPLMLNAPRSIAFSKDGSMYIADTRNHRIVRLDKNRELVQSWGSFADGISIPTAPGTFNEPWGVATGPDGSVFVTDTWNHRVQKFTSDGEFITSWGVFGQGETPESLYGPRGVGVGADGRVFVADTGNKRIVVFDPQGNYITQFGSAGLEAGQFDEPVGVAVTLDGRVFVTDTWNQRIQSFVPTEDGTTYLPDKQWDVYGWFGQSLDNKPFIAVDNQGQVFITDPEGFRVMQFSESGGLIRVWGDFDNTATGFGLASGIAVDAQNHVWVTDGLYNRILRFTLP